MLTRRTNLLSAPIARFGEEPLARPRPARPVAPAPRPPAAPEYQAARAGVATPEGPQVEVAAPVPDGASAGPTEPDTAPEVAGSGGHDPGPPPRFGLLDIAALQIDPRYQRDVSGRASQALIRRIAAGFRWALYQPLTVAESAGAGGQAASYAVIDGQHRLEAAKRAGFARLPCYIIDAASVELQAESFVALNRERRSLLPTQLHRAAVVAGDEEALQIERVCRLAGVTVAQTGRPEGLPPGQTLAVQKIRGLIGRHGERVTADALRLVREAAGSRRDQLRAEIIAGVAELVARHDWCPPGTWDEAVLRRTIASRTAQKWLHQARERKGEVGGSTGEAFAELFARAYRRELQGEQR